MMPAGIIEGLDKIVKDNSKNSSANSAQEEINLNDLLECIEAILKSILAQNKRKSKQNNNKIANKFMGEIQLTRIKSIYGDAKGLLGQIPVPEKQSMVKEFTVQNFNDVVDELSQVSSTDYSSCKIPESQRSNNWHDSFPSIVVRAQIGRLVSRLEEEYGFGKDQSGNSPSIAIFNRNNNEVSVQINYTLNDLIEKVETEEGKIQLRELRDELNKSDKNWEKIKNILIWILNFSKDLFLEILPIILQNKI